MNYKLDFIFAILKITVDNHQMINDKICSKLKKNIPRLLFDHQSLKPGRLRICFHMWSLYIFFSSVSSNLSMATMKRCKFIGFLEIVLKRRFLNIICSSVYLSSVLPGITFSSTQQIQPTGRSTLIHWSIFVNNIFESIARHFQG